MKDHGGDGTCLGAREGKGARRLRRGRGGRDGGRDGEDEAKKLSIHEAMRGDCGAGRTTRPMER